MSDGGAERSLGGSPPPPRRPQRRRRRPDTGVRFWERDATLLGYVGEQYAITVAQLARLTTGNIHTATALRNRWRRAGWIDGQPLLWKGPSFLWLTHAGAVAARSPYKPRAASPTTAEHVHAVTEVRLLLEHELGLGRWRSVRELAYGRGLVSRGTSSMFPDAELELPSGRAAIEVELSPKVPARLAEIISLRASSHAEVWYFATPPVLRLLRRVNDEARWPNVRVYPYPPLGEDFGR